MAISDKNKLILQNILAPGDETCTEESMYYRDSGCVRSYNGYFNIFSLHKWLHYTKLNKLRLHVESAGQFSVRVVNESGKVLAAYNTQPGVNDNTSEKTEENCTATWKKTGINISADIEITYNETDKVLWFEYEALSDGAYLEKAYYYTTDKPAVDVKLALDICTYKREQYVRRNINVLGRSILDNPDSALYGKVDVYIIDNGQTLDKSEFETEHIRVYPNMNAGGAGGFTRGLIEILHNKDKCGYTHMVFLDDDAVQEPDAFVRTAAFMSLIKPEYSKSSISGSMLRLDRRYMLHEAGALWTGSELKQPHQGYDLRELSKVIANEDIYDIDYGAWFYCCYPLSVINEDSLPLPVFIHMDDIEYGLRNHNGVIVLNGICVWHDAFNSGRSSSMGYYDMRNSFIMNAVHDTDKGVAAINKMLLRACVGDCFRYRYEDFKIKCYAIEEFLKGPEYIGSIDPVKKNTEVSKLGYANVPIEELTKDPTLIAQMRQIAADKANSRLYQSDTITNKRKYWLTFNGIIMPVKTKIKALPMNASPYAMYRTGELILFDPDSMKGFRVQRSLYMTVNSILQCIKMQIKLFTKYKRVKQQYKQGINKLMNEEFWREYLKLE